MFNSIITKLGNIEKFENDTGKWEYYNFMALENGKIVAQMAVDRLIEPKEDWIAKDPFFWDFDSSPIKPVPYLFAIDVNEEYRGRGIAGNLIEFANDYFKNRFKIHIQSGLINEGAMQRVWEKLVENKKAMECVYNGEKMWKMFL